jgi:DNA polymerase
MKEWRRIQKLWRENNAAIVQFWRDIEDAAREAIDNPGELVSLGFLSMIVKSGCLFIRLPSGRSLRYWRPKIVPTTKEIKVVDDDGNVTTREMTSREIRFFTMSKDKRGMVVESTYGGKLTENVTQAVARELLGDALVRIDRTDPYDIVVHVHDSIVSEVTAGAGDVDEFCSLMATAPDWAEGLPLDVEGYRAKRFNG